MGKLTPAELLRDKRDREFQARVLTAVDKPKQRRIIAVINSPFFLWVISAILVSATASYLTASTACTAEAERLLETHDKITSELASRYRQTLQGILAAKSSEEVVIFVDEIPSKSSEFKNRSTSSLWSQAHRINEKSYQTNVPIFPHDQETVDRWEHLNEIFVGDRGMIRLYPLKDMQEWARDAKVAKIQEIAGSFWLEPECSRWQIFLRMIGFSPAIFRKNWYDVPVKSLPSLRIL